MHSLLLSLSLCRPLQETFSDRAQVVMRVRQLVTELDRSDVLNALEEIEGAQPAPTQTSVEPRKDRPARVSRVRALRVPVCLIPSAGSTWRVPSGVACASADCSNGIVRVEGNVSDAELIRAMQASHIVSNNPPPYIHTCHASPPPPSYPTYPILPICVAAFLYTSTSF